MSIHIIVQSKFFIFCWSFVMNCLLTFLENFFCLTCCVETFYEDYQRRCQFFEMNDQLIGDIFRHWLQIMMSEFFSSIYWLFNRNKKKNKTEEYCRIANERSWSIWKWIGLMKLESNIYPHPKQNWYRLSNTEFHS